jgi:predicted DNA-binding protein
MKTLAIRLEEEQHAQLTVLAQLEEIPVTDFIRQAIETHVQAKKAQPELAARAEQVLADIDAQAAHRRSAIATLFANSEGDKGEGEQPASGRSRRRNG